MNERKRLRKEYMRELFSSDISEEGRRKCREAEKRYKASKKRKVMDIPPADDDCDFLLKGKAFFNP